jgi:tetratricopeptide (TPR) repeat protein
MFLGQQVEQDDPRMSRVYDNFESNLRDILQLGLEHRAKIVLSTVGVNLKDCAPFASRHRAGLEAERLKAWETEFTAGLAATNDPALAISHFQRAAEIDDRFAELHYRWGRACLAQGRDAEAGRHLSLARDLDTLRFRADTRLNEIARGAVSNANRADLALVDVEKILNDQSPQGVSGAEFFYEHVHLNFQGNYQTALAIARQVEKFLPESVARDKARPEWATTDAVAARLAWTDSQRLKVMRSIMLRLSGPPFSNQSDNLERIAAVQRDIETLLTSVRQTKPSQSVEACQNALRLRPNDWTLRSLLAQCDQQAGDLKGCEEERRNIVSQLPHSASLRSELGLALLQNGRVDEALAEFNTVLKQQPRQISAIDGKGLALAKIQSMEEALQLFALSAKLRPQSMEACLNYGNALNATGRKTAALEQYRAACNCEAEKPDTVGRLAQTVYNLGWTNDAIRCFEQSCRLDPFDAKTSLYYAQALSSAGRHAQARAQFRETARINPAMPEPHLGLAMDLLAEQDANGAARELNEAIRIDPNFLSGHLNLGILEWRAKNREAAAAHFREVLRIDPKNTVARQFFGETRLER